MASSDSIARRWRPYQQDRPLPRRLGAQHLSAHSVARIVQPRGTVDGFGLLELRGQSLKRSALTAHMDRGNHPAKIKWLGWHKSFDVLYTWALP